MSERMPLAKRQGGVGVVVVAYYLWVVRAQKRREAMARGGGGERAARAIYRDPAHIDQHSERLVAATLAVPLERAEEGAT